MMLAHYIAPKKLISSHTTSIMVDISKLLKAVVAEFLRKLAQCIPSKAEEVAEEVADVANTVANDIDPVPQEPK